MIVYFIYITYAVNYDLYIFYVYIYILKKAYYVGYIFVELKSCDYFKKSTSKSPWICLYKICTTPELLLL